nr:MAG: hypothetical protein AmFV_00006 [Apis mellifera filamentous virus]WOK43403.1 MAG: hypothetical protein [Apis mellifera filamentous virus]WOK43408.1 MAG: hypothetical protein [Apis mellifera filamentous virus]WOK43635.1 MAG: hypothetical protein [Apis mellifera filamentous virus]
MVLLLRDGNCEYSQLLMPRLFKPSTVLPPEPIKLARDNERLWFSNTRRLLFFPSSYYRSARQRSAFRKSEKLISPSVITID